MALGGRYEYYGSEPIYAPTPAEVAAKAAADAAHEAAVAAAQAVAAQFDGAKIGALTWAVSAAPGNPEVTVELTAPDGSTMRVAPYVDPARVEGMLTRETARYAVSAEIQSRAGRSPSGYLDQPALERATDAACAALGI